MDDGKIVRHEIERLLRQLYDARISGNLNALCLAFAEDATFQIGGAGEGSAVVNRSVGVGQFRPLLAAMIKTFKLSDQVILSTLVDGMRAAVHWRANVYSRITGVTVQTELVDLVEFNDGRIVRYTEFFVPSGLRF